LQGGGWHCIGRRVSDTRWPSDTTTRTTPRRGTSAPRPPTAGRSGPGPPVPAAAAPRPGRAAALPSLVRPPRQPVGARWHQQGVLEVGVVVRAALAAGWLFGVYTTGGRPGRKICVATSHTLKLPLGVTCNA
jgi:hypothetical protein